MPLNTGPQSIAFYSSPRLKVWLTFIPQDEDAPYEVEVVRSGQVMGQRYATEKAAVQDFRAYVRADLSKLGD